MKEIKLTLILIRELEKLSDKDFAEYMKDKILLHDGKKFVLPVKEVSRKKEKVCHVN